MNDKLPTDDVKEKLGKDKGRAKEALAFEEKAKAAEEEERRKEEELKKKEELGKAAY